MCRARFCAPLRFAPEQRQSFTRHRRAPNYGNHRARVSEYSEGDPVPPKELEWDPDRGPRPNAGFIGIQNHPQGKGVLFKKVSVHPIER